MRSDVRRRRKKSRIIIPFIFLVLTAAGVCYFLSTNMKIEIFKTGELTYGDGLTDDEKDLIKSLVKEDQKFSEDLKIDGLTLDEFKEQDNMILADVLVPVTDFYSEKTDLEKSLFDELATDLFDTTKTTKTTDPGTNEADDSDTNDNFEKIAELISINDLTPEKKLLSVDGKYYLDDFKNGAKYRVISIDKSSSEASEILEKVKEKITAPPEKSEILSINQTGVTALTRKLQAKLNEKGDASYFTEKIKDFLKSTDLTHISNEVSFADNCTTDSKTTTLCADPRMMGAIEAIGTDIVELTGNHNNDWGKEKNLETIKAYEEKGLKIFGGGKDEESAKIPLELDKKGTKITWIGVNYSTSTKENGQGATEKNPGANIYDEGTIKSQIKSAKEDGNFVIVDVQFFECYSYPERGAEMPSCDAPIENQEDFFRHLVDLGADLVIGTSAHQPQTYELYNNTPIYYGLGNLFFDQIAWPGTTRSLILTHYFKDGKLIQTRVSPTSYDATFQTAIMDKADGESFIKRLLYSSPEGK